MFKVNLLVSNTRDEKKKRWSFGRNRSVYIDVGQSVLVKPMIRNFFVLGNGPNALLEVPSKNRYSCSGFLGIHNVGNGRDLAETTEILCIWDQIFWHVFY